MNKFENFANDISQFPELIASLVSFTSPHQMKELQTRVEDITSNLVLLELEFIITPDTNLWLQPEASQISWAVYDLLGQLSSFDLSHLESHYILNEMHQRWLNESGSAHQGYYECHEVPDSTTLPIRNLVTN